MASKGLCSVLEFGKLSWPEILYFENSIKQSDPELRKAEEDQKQYEEMMKRLQNAK